MLALPLQSGLAQETLNLYQPQKWKGRLTRSIYRGLIKTGVYQLLPKFTIVDGSQGLLSVLNDQVWEISGWRAQGTQKHVSVF